MCSIFTACVTHLSFRFEETLYRTFHGCFLPNFGSLGQAVSEEKTFLEIDQRISMIVNRWGRNEQSLYKTFHKCFLLRFGSFGPVVAEEKIFRNRSIRNKNCLWQPCLLTNRDQISNLYRGPSINAPYPVSVHLATWFQKRKFF